MSIGILAAQVSMRRSLDAFHAVALALDIPSATATEILNARMEEQAGTLALSGRDAFDRAKRDLVTLSWFWHKKLFAPTRIAPAGMWETTHISMWGRVIRIACDAADATPIDQVVVNGRRFLPESPKPEGEYVIEKDTK